jgi:signal transduction histidine kinase
MPPGTASTVDTLYRSTRDLMRADDRETVCEVVVDSASEILDVPVVGVHLDDGQGNLVPVATTAAARERRDGEVPVYEADTDAGNDRLVWEAFESGSPRRLTDGPTPAGVDGLLVPIGDHGILLGFPPSEGTLPGRAVESLRLLAANAEAALDRRRRERGLRRRNDRLDEFAAVVGHDLRNPLAVASGHLELARETGEEDHFDAVADAHDRMDTLLGDLLQLARDGWSVDGAETEPVAVGKLARELAGAATVDVVVTESVTVTADPSRLRELLDNLIENAAEHAGAHPTVRIGTLDAGADEGFYLADDGPGVPAGVRNRVFERGHSGRDGGTGLGLTVVRRIVRAHGWAVDLVESRDGGARFEVRTDPDGAPDPEPIGDGGRR